MAEDVLQWRQLHAVERKHDALKVKVEQHSQNIARLPAWLVAGRAASAVPKQLAATVVRDGELVVADAVALLKQTNNVTSSCWKHPG